MTLGERMGQLLIDRARLAEEQRNKCFELCSDMVGELAVIRREMMSAPANMNPLGGKGWIAVEDVEDWAGRLFKMLPTVLKEKK